MKPTILLRFIWIEFWGYTHRPVNSRFTLGQYLNQSKKFGSTILTRLNLIINLALMREHQHKEQLPTRDKRACRIKGHHHSFRSPFMSENGFSHCAGSHIEYPNTARTRLFISAIRPPYKSFPVYLGLQLVYVVLVFIGKIASICFFDGIPV